MFGEKLYLTKIFAYFKYDLNQFATKTSSDEQRNKFWCNFEIGLYSNLKEFLFSLMMFI